ncbi:unnamed protein product, partial [Meganyctiphanes norvegica]
MAASSAAGGETPAACRNPYLSYKSQTHFELCDKAAAVAQGAPPGEVRNSAKRTDNIRDMEQKVIVTLDNATCHPPTLNDIDDLIQVIFSLKSHAINRGDVKKLNKELSDDEKALNSSRCMGLAPIHAAVKAQNIEILRELLNKKALISTRNLFGNTALHIAAQSGWHKGIKELLQYGASPDKMTDLPPLLNEVVGETPLHIAVRKGDLQSVALMLRKEPDLTLCDTRQCNLLHLAAKSHSLPIITRLLQETQCRKMICEKNWVGNSALHTTLGLKSLKENEDCKVLEVVKALIDAGAEVNSINNSGECPLYRAAFAHLPEIVELLLKRNADPTTLTLSNQSVIHAACASGCSESLKHLLSSDCTSNYISHIDNDGNEPFHLAVKSCSISCCEVLLDNGDHLTKTDYQGITRFSLILEHLPSATQLIRSLLDKHISITKTMRHDPDFKVTFDYSPLLAPKTKRLQCSVISELSLSKHEVLFNHPLIESFLRTKWRSISVTFYIYVAVYCFFLIMHTIFVLITYGTPLKENNSEDSLGVIQNSSNLNNSSDLVHKELICADSVWCNYTTTLTYLRIVYAFMYILIIIPSSLIIMTNIKKYMRSWEIYIKIVAYTTSFYVVFSPNLVSSSTILIAERPVAAVSALFSWAVLMMQLSRLPALGVYILMFTHVAKSIMKMLVAFSTLIIGFAVSFQILYRDQSVFDNFLHSFVKILMMMIGEINYIEMAASDTNATNNVTVIFGSFFLMIFLFYVTVLMTNLLIGVAVHDVPVLLQEGNIRHLSKRASFLVAYEKALLYFQKNTFFPKSILNLLARPCYIHPKKEIFPNKYRKNKILTVPLETIEEAIAICNRPANDENISVDCGDEDPSKLFKTFQVLYFKDKKVLDTNIKQIANECKKYSSIMENIQLLHEKMDHQETLICNFIASQRYNSQSGPVLSKNI